MRSVAIICTEKDDLVGRVLLNMVLDRLRNSPIDEIVVVQNYFGIRRDLPGATVLHLPKTNDYELARCANRALGYLEEKYSDPITILALGDDILVADNMVERITNNLPPKTIRQPVGQYIHWPLQPDFSNHFVPDFNPKHSVPNLNYVLDRIDRIGSDLMISGVFALVWDQHAKGIRFDENYNGAWGYEDTDFVMQLIELGFSVVPAADARGWHVATPWKHDNHLTYDHQSKISGNSNAKYFREKWLARRQKPATGPR